MIAMARHVPDANSSIKAGKWERSKFVGTELKGKTIAILGLGKG
jgi:D-3-phosphoglycerate dehydrogenase